MASGKAAAQGLVLIRLHGHDPHIVGPAFYRLAYTGHSPGAAHPHDDGIHQAGILPSDGLQDGGPGDPAVVFGVVVVGQPVHIIPALFGGSALRHGSGTGQPALGGGEQQLRAQAQQGLLPQRRCILRHGQPYRVPGGQSRQSQGHAKSSGGSLHHRLTRGKAAFFRCKGQHALGQRIPAGAGGAAKIQVGVQLALQAAGGGITPQFHNGTGQQSLIEIGVNRHSTPPLRNVWIQADLIVTQSGALVKGGGRSCRRIKCRKNAASIKKSPVTSKNT